MKKLSETDGRVVYSQGNAAAMLFGLLVPAGIAIRYFLGDGFMPMWIIVLLGGGGFLVGAFGQRFVIDSVTRTITRTKTIVGRATREETIPYARVERVAVVKAYARDKPRGAVREDGFQVSLEWDVGGRQGGETLDNFWEENRALAAAEKLAARIGTKVERRDH